MHQRKTQPPALSPTDTSPSPNHEPTQSVAQLNNGDSNYVSVGPARPDNLQITLESTSSSPVHPTPASPPISNEDQRRTSSSYSPVTYDGSASADEGGPHLFSPPETSSVDSLTRAGTAEEDFVFPPDKILDKQEENGKVKEHLLSKSCEILRGDIIAVNDETLASSLPSTPAKKKRSLASRFRDRIHFRKKSKSSVLSDSLSPKPSVTLGVHQAHFLPGKERNLHSSSEAEWPQQQQFSPPARPRSYTKLTEHITEKYRIMSSQRKHQESNRQHRNPEEDRHQRHLTTPAQDPIHTLLSSSSVEVFKQCLVFKQLKYKLAIALQNVHMPLAEVKVGQSCKNQLVSILKSALQRSMWLRDCSEVSLLQEIFKILEPLAEQQ